MSAAGATPAATRVATGVVPGISVERWQRAITQNPAAAAEVLSSLHRPVHDRDDLIALLQVAVVLAARHVEVVDHASVTAQLGTRSRAVPFTAAATDVIAGDFDEQQYTVGDGPGLHAMRTQQPVLLTQAQLQRRWPALGAASAGHLQEFWSLPLSATTAPGVSLNLYSTTPGGFTCGRSDLLHVLVELVTRAVTDYSAVHQATELVHQLRFSHDTRAPIEQAKGILMAVHHIGADAAFTLLRQQSHHSNTKLRDVAVHLVATHTNQPADAPTTPSNPHHEPRAEQDRAGVDSPTALDPAALDAAFDPAPRGEEDPGSTDLTARVTPPDGSTTVLAVFTAHHQPTEQLRQRALHDALTGAANRTLLIDRVIHALQRRDLRRHPVTLLHLDINDFQGVNDTYGHNTGDAVLLEVVHRLREVSRAEDTVARLGGDEFVLLCQDTTAEQATTHAHRIHKALLLPVAVGGQNVGVSAAIGSATTTNAATTARDLLHDADAAMYTIKRQR